MSQHYIHQMALYAKDHAKLLPIDVSTELPGYACLVGNVLETAGVAFAQPDCSFEMVRTFFFCDVLLESHLFFTPCMHTY